jgi:hypothetical protein
LPSMRSGSGACAAAEDGSTSPSAMAHRATSRDAGRIKRVTFRA